jgi:hypothetical protein
MINRAVAVLRVALVATMLWVPSRLGAQRSVEVSVRVRVIDSAGAPIADADASVVHGTTDIIAHASTNRSGQAILSLKREGGEFQLVVRRVGFLPYYRFLSAEKSDSLAIDITLARPAVTLAPVKVTAAENLTRKSYHLDADDIEHSNRPMIDGTDIFKLRRDMMSSRGGQSACAVPYTPRDGWIESVWVNGRRVQFAEVDQQALDRRAALGIPATSTRTRSRKATVVESHAHIDTVLSILRLIHPEHIAEITYHDCFDQSVGAVNSDMAMFIVLKPGIGFKDGIGSYVVDDAAATHDARIAVNDLPAYRSRMLGLFDAADGEPIEGAQVLDSATGTHTITTATGTVALVFVPEGAATLLIHRAGYRDTSITISISPRDTVPITLILRRPEHPPLVEVSAGTEHFARLERPS